MSHIIGLGSDLVEIHRFESHAGAGSPLAKRVLTESELAELEDRGKAGMQRAASYLASRYAAKEAFSKALGTGIGGELSFQDLCVLNNEKGAPYFTYSERMAQVMADNGWVALLTLSDEKSMAMATVMIQKI